MKAHRLKKLAGVASLVLIGLTLLGVAAGPSLAARLGPLAAMPTGEVSATVETEPVPHGDDAADDAAIWAHPSDPSLSTIIGTDKRGGLAVYDLAGRELFYYADGKMNNVDLRYDFPLGSATVTLVGVTNTSANSLDFYRVEESDRSLTRVGSIAGSVPTVTGVCLYRSAASGRYYAFVSYASARMVAQYELGEAGGEVTGTLVRTLDVGGRTEGVVADDDLKRLYVSEEEVGNIWRYGAEPEDGAARTRVDGPILGSALARRQIAVALGGRIWPDVEGLAIYYAANQTGYLIASIQGSDTFHVYDRVDNSFVGAFRIVAGNGIDGVSHTDGIDVTSTPLGSSFPQGVFVAQDHVNDAGNQSFKLVPWQSIAGAFRPPLEIDTSVDPRR